MKLVVQRVNNATVSRMSDNKVVGQIEKGMFVLVGFKKGDSKVLAEVAAEKITKVRLMGDDQNKMNLSIKDVNGKVLVVSQFTLYADTSGGNRPSFIEAEEPSKAKILYELFISKLQQNGLSVETGSFGDYMLINASLDGPVTVIYNL